MNRDNRRQDGRAGDATTMARTRSRQASLAVEALEGRQLLSIYLGPTKSRPLFSGQAFYQVEVTGPGYQTVKTLGKGFHRVIAINLFGTTAESQLNITQSSVRARFGRDNTRLQVGQINVQSGLLGGINAAGTADLLGSVSTLENGVTTLAFNSLGPNARINVQGSVGNVQVGSTNLSPNGLVQIDGDVTGQFNVGTLGIDGGKVIIGRNVAGGLNLGGVDVTRGGQFIVGNDVTATSSLGTMNVDGGLVLLGHDVTAPLSTNDLTVQNAGQFIVGNDLSGGLRVAGAGRILTNGIVQVVGNLASLDVTQGLTIDSSGKLVVGNDATGPITVGSGVTLANNAQLSVGRDVLGGVTITGDLRLDSGAGVSVGRNLNGLNVNGDVRFTPSAGTISVRGNLVNFNVNGAYRGRAITSASSPELIVGLDLTNFTVLHGGGGQAGIEDANIDVGKSIVGLDIRHGIFHSLVTAGVLIDGAPQNASGGGNVGPDGVEAILNTELRAGLQVKNFLINGNVKSDFVTNPRPRGFPTRIIAGEDRQGNFLTGGNIDNFQITGTLIDSVLAASVQPYGGDGTLPPGGYGGNRAPAPDPGGVTTYDAPAGVIVGGTVGGPVAYPNYTNVSYYNETAVGTAYNTAIDPTIDDNILPGAINPSFASRPLTGEALAEPESPLPLPTRSTVFGGVISTSHGDNPDAFDFAGLFAADTRGVFIGTLPQ